MHTTDSHLTGTIHPAVADQRPARKCLRAGLSLCAAIALSPAAAGAVASSMLPHEVSQGALVVGRAPRADCLIVYAGRDLRVGADGSFLFGVGRDAYGPLRVRVDCPGSKAVERRIAVTPRDWPVERVNGVPPKTVRPPPAIAARIAREQAAVAQARTRDDDREDFLGGFDWPVHGRISGRFGNQRVYNGVPKAPHSGMDIAVPTGTPVRAPAAGVVTLARPDLYLTGGTVLIDHGFGLSSVLLHMSRLGVKVGQHVRKGQVIGASGMTGRATGPHVHWGMNWFGVRIDPLLVVGPSARRR